MQKSCDNKKTKTTIYFAVILFFFALTVLSDIIEIRYSNNPFYNRLIAKTVQQVCGSVAGILILLRLNIRLFKKPQMWLYLIPCFIVALNNFQFCAYFSGKMQLIHTKAIDFLLFFAYCCAVALFEEIIFRGVFFNVVAGFFSKDRKGLLKTFFVTSIVFGLAHVFNGFSIGTLLQVGYTILTGGLFAFCLMKTKNILCSVLVHAVYNFAGMLFDTQGLGNGVVFDAGTVIMMAGIGVIIGIFILYKVWRYPEMEREELYARLGVSQKDDEI